MLIYSCGVCLDDGWYKQPHLSRVRRITRCIEQSTCTVKPAITTQHTKSPFVALWSVAIAWQMERTSVLIAVRLSWCCHGDETMATWCYWTVTNVILTPPRPCLHLKELTHGFDGHLTCSCGYGPTSVPPPVAVRVDRRGTRYIKQGPCSFN